MDLNTQERIGHAVSIVLFCIIIAGLIVLAIARPERNEMPKYMGNPHSTQQGGGTQGTPSGADNGLRKNLPGPTPVKEDK